VAGTEDWLFLMKLIHAGHPLDVIRRPLVRYRFHAGNDTADPLRREEAFSAALAYIEREGLLEGRSLRRVRAHTAGTIGRGFARAGDMQGARRWAREAGRSRSFPETAKAELGIAASALRGRLA
jgi:hypothetical protein